MRLKAHLLLGVLCVILILSGCQSAPAWHWERADAGLPRQTVVLALALDPDDPNHIWAGYYAPDGLATSQDQGATFVRFGDGPVLGPSLHEPFLVGDPFVRVEDGTWHMWYIHGTRWMPAAEKDGNPARIYKIAHATSPDPVHWRPSGGPVIDDRLGPTECQALPTVIAHQGRHHMYFCYREAVDFRKNRDRGYRLGYAWSENLRDWTRRDDEDRVGDQKPDN